MLGLSVPLQSQRQVCRELRLDGQGFSSLLQVVFVRRAPVVDQDAILDAVGLSSDPRSRQVFRTERRQPTLALFRELIA
jgi:hypothetical protein